MYTVDLFQIRNWKAAARTGEGWREVIGEVTSRELAAEPQKKENTDLEGHVLVTREGNTVQVSALDAGDTNTVTSTGYRYISVSLSP
jgi:hypothetical protein